ncbi:uncharacterized protein LOC120331394 isoform X2 [Styela clava]
MGKKTRILDIKKSKKTHKDATKEKVTKNKEIDSKATTSVSESLNLSDSIDVTNHECEGLQSSIHERNQDSRLSQDTVLSNKTTSSNSTSVALDTIPNTEAVNDAGNIKNIEGKEQKKQSSFQVFVRIRPLDDTAPDTITTRLRSLTVENDNQLQLCTRPSKAKESNGTKHLFTFAHVFPESTPQREVFEVSAQSLVNAVLTGHRACVVSYGIPNTGKSYTLYGKATSGKHRGIIMRTMESMLNIVNNDTAENTSYDITTSFLQLYNEKFYDLLDPSKSDGLKIQENGDMTSIEGSTQITVKTADDVSKQLRRSPNRMRDAGSRSHTIFTVRIRKEEMMTAGDNDDAAEESVKVTEGEMRFVDLVGVERSVKHATYESPAVGSAEAKTVKSLQLFANLVVSLANDKNAVVGYRDSKLTRLLRNALGGDCTTRMIVTTSPCPNLAHETLSCLQFAQKACQVINHPLPRVDIVNRRKKTDTPESPDPKNEEKLEQNKKLSHLSSTPSSSPCNKLPPIHTSPDERRLSVSAEGLIQTTQEETFKTNSSRPGSATSSDIYKHREHGSPLSRSTTPSSGVFSSPSPSNDRKNLTPDGLLYMQVKSPEAGNKVLSLPVLSSSGTGQIITHQTGQNTKSNERLATKTSPGEVNSRRASRRQKPHEKLAKKLSGGTPQTDFASTIQPAAEHIINGEIGFVNVQSSPANRKVSLTNSKEPEVAMVQVLGQMAPEREKSCCVVCKSREEKIKADYDRMILFSKKDRDDKHAKIEELHQEIKKLKNETASMNTIRALEEERSQDKIAKEIQGKEIVRLESLVETLKLKLLGMVNSSEVTTLQDLRRKDHQTIDKLKSEIDTIKLQMKEESEKHKREIINKNETIKRVEREMNQLRKEVTDKEKALLEVKKQHEERVVVASVELQKIQARHESIINEFTLKLANSAKEITKLKESETKMFKQRQDERDNLERELALAKQNASHAQAELKIAQGKIISLEREQRMTKSSGFNPMTSSRHSLRRNMDFRDTGTAMSNSPDLERDGACVSCGRQLNRQDFSTDINRDEELRILLLQDARNREVLIQLKRERNLLCDVMKIMYCRQWFLDEAEPHVKRTLRRVGIDTRSLGTLRKKI